LHTRAAFRKPDLIGRKIVALEKMPADPVGGTPDRMVIVLDDGTFLWPSVSDEKKIDYRMSIMASRAGADWALDTDYRATR
jgi:hypothetical protein